MWYAFEMVSGAMMYIRSFINTDFGIQKLIGGDSQAHRQHGDLISLLLFYFFQNKRSRLISSEVIDLFRSNRRDGREVGRRNDAKQGRVASVYVCLCLARPNS
jgi:hypothetical protein